MSQTLLPTRAADLTNGAIAERGQITAAGSQNDNRLGWPHWELLML